MHLHSTSPADTTPPPTPAPIVFLRFQPAWAYLDDIRQFVTSVCARTFQSADVVDRAAVIVQEALENAIKYSRADTDVALELTLEGGGDELSLSVSSAPDVAHLERLKAEVRAMQSLAPEQAYQAAFLRAANEPNEASRLGLARICYEGRVDLEVHEEAGGRIRVTAKGRVK